MQVTAISRDGGGVGVKAARGETSQRVCPAMAGSARALCLLPDPCDVHTLHHVAASSSPPPQAQSSPSSPRFPRYLQQVSSRALISLQQLFTCLSLSSDTESLDARDWDLVDFYPLQFT